MKNVNKVTNKITHSHTNTKLERERERDDDESLMQIDLSACDFVPFFFVLIHTILIHTFFLYHSYLHFIMFFVLILSALDTHKTFKYRNSPVFLLHVFTHENFKFACSFPH